MYARLILLVRKPRCQLRHDLAQWRLRVARSAAGVAGANHEASHAFCTVSPLPLLFGWRNLSSVYTSWCEHKYFINTDQGWRPVLVHWIFSKTIWFTESYSSTPGLCWHLYFHRKPMLASHYLNLSCLFSMMFSMGIWKGSIWTDSQN
jgi:hypothetical protein